MNHRSPLTKIVSPLLSLLLISQASANQEPSYRDIVVNGQLYQNIEVLNINHELGFIEMEHSFGVRGFKFEDLPQHFLKQHSINLNRSELASLREYATLKMASTNPTTSQPKTSSTSAKKNTTPPASTRIVETRFVLPISERERRTVGHRSTTRNVIQIVGNTTEIREVGQNSNRRRHNIITRVPFSATGTRRSVNQINHTNNIIRVVDNNVTEPRSVGNYGNSRPNIIHQVDTSSTYPRTVGVNDYYYDNVRIPIRRVDSNPSYPRSVGQTGSSQYIKKRPVDTGDFTRRSVGSNTRANNVIKIIKTISYLPRTVGQNSSQRYDRNHSIKHVKTDYKNTRSVGYGSGSGRNHNIKVVTEPFGTRRTVGQAQGSSTRIIKVVK